MHPEYPVEEGIPIPPPRGPKSGPQPNSLTSQLKRLKIGASFVLPIPKGKKFVSVHHSAQLAGIKIASRKISPTEVRVWRVPNLPSQ